MDISNFPKQFAFHMYNESIDDHKRTDWYNLGDFSKDDLYNYVNGIKEEYPGYQIYIVYKMEIQ